MLQFQERNSGDMRCFVSGATCRKEPGVFVLKKVPCRQCGGMQILRPQNGRLVVECRSCGERQPAKPEASGHPLLLIERPSAEWQVRPAVE